MDPKRKQQIAAALAVVALLIWARGFFGRPARSKQPADLQTKTVSPAHLAYSPGRADTEGPVSDTASATSRFTQWSGNPFEIEHRPVAPTPAMLSAESPSGYSVSGILWDAQTPSAIVNGRLVGLGDELSGGWKVIEIQKEKVILSDGLTTQTLTVD